MNKPKSSPTTFPPPKHPQFILQQTLTTFQNNFSTLLHHITQNPSSLKTHLHSTLSRLQAHATHALNPSANTPAWARIAQPGRRSPAAARRGPKLGLSAVAIEERLDGVPVYGLSNANDEFVLVSGASSQKTLSLFCFKKEDAEALLLQINSMEPDSGSRVVPVALNQVFNLKVDGVAFRLIPDTSEVKNAMMMRENDGSSDESFWGVPVFQARSLVLRSENKNYRPAFFKKEDLEKSLLQASRAQGKLYPGLRTGEIQVAVFEDVIKSMKESSSQWSDTVFVPPGFDISSGPTKGNNN